MGTIKKFLFSLVIVLILYPFAASAEPVVFGTFPIPLMVIDEHRGVFIDLVRAIGEKSGLDIRFRLAPPKRATANFKNGKTQVLFPVINTLFTGEEKYLRSSEIFYERRDFAFTPKGFPLLTDIKSLEGKRVGITRGYRYSAGFLTNEEILFDLANGDDLNVKKLFAGRIQAFVVEEKSGLKAFKKAGRLSDIQYDAKSPVSKENIYFAFHNTPEGKALEVAVSTALRELKAKGTFQRIMQCTR